MPNSLNSDRSQQLRGKVSVNGFDRPFLPRLAASGAVNMHIFTELVGIQMLLMNTLEPLLRGDKLAQDQLNILFSQVQTTKAAKAQELLAKRSQKQEK
jgi:hypothetical protein